MKKLLGAIAALLVLLTCASAFADIEATSSVNLRSGPGKKYKVVAKVKKGTMLTDLDSVMEDSSGGKWYWVEYKGKECWVSAEFARVIGGSEEQGASGMALEAYIGQNAAEAAKALGLGEVEELGGEWERCYFNDSVLLYETGGVVVGIGLSMPESGVVPEYSVYDARLGMNLREAAQLCVLRGLYEDSGSYSAIYLYKDAESDTESKQLVSLYHDEDGTVTRIEWAYALEDEY